MLSRRCVVVIPCRYGSSRFPGKPLASLAGKPLVWHVYQRCSQARLVDEVVVATDDERIAHVCREFEMRAVMTGLHATGTDRVAECARHLDVDGYVNVQGDEPLIRPDAIDAVVSALTDEQDDSVMAINAYAPIGDPAEVVDHNVVKVTLCADGSALAFSRHPIPYPHADRPSYLRQIGLYGFTSRGLETFARLRPGPAEKAESIEMMRFLEHGLRIRMVRADDVGLAVDTPGDLARAEALIGREPPLGSPH